MLLPKSPSIRIAGARLEDCLWLHSGVERPAEPMDSGEAYTENAHLPVGERRRLSQSELDSISSSWHWPPTRCISRLKIQDQAIGEMRRLEGTSASNPSSEQFAVQGLEFWQMLTKSCALSSLGPTQWLGISSRPSGLRTSTIDSTCGRRIGLHLDSWDQAPLRERDACRTRLCINLGVRTRSLLFVPYCIAEIVDALRSYPQVHNANIGGQFCEQYPEAPVLELEIPPGYAYLAPTENLLHDGSSEISPEYDLTAQWLGYIVHFASPAE